MGWGQVWKKDKVKEKEAAEAKGEEVVEAKVEVEEAVEVKEEEAVEVKAKDEEDGVDKNTPEYKHYTRIEARKAAIEKAWEPKTEAELEEIEAKYDAIEDIPTRVFTVLCDLGMAEPPPLDEDHPDYWDGVDTDDIVPLYDTNGNWVDEWPEEP